MSWVGATVVASAVLTPIAVWAVEAVAPGQVPVRRIFNRCLLVSAVLLGWPFLRHLGIGSWRDLGWVGPLESGGRRLGLAFLGSFGILGGLYGVAWLVGGRMGLSWPGWEFVGWSLVFAALVGVVEETVFRGALFLALVRQGASVWATVAANAVLFASVHFFKAPDVAGEVTWWTGFAIWGSMLGGWWTEGEGLWRWGALAGLAVAMAGLARKEGGLWMATGAHAGLVLAMKLALGGSTFVPGNVGGWFGSDGISGPVPFLAALIGAVWVWRWRRSG